MRHGHTLREAGDRADHAIARAKKEARRKLARQLEDHPALLPAARTVADRTGSRTLARAARSAAARRRTTPLLTAGSILAGGAAAVCIATHLRAAAHQGR